MSLKKIKFSTFLGLLILLSIFITFYKSVIQKDFDILLPPEGEYPENV